MKIFFLFAFFLSNYCLSQVKINNFEIKDLSDSIKTSNYLHKVNNCDLLLFANKNYKFFADPNNTKKTQLIFSEISKRTKQDIFILLRSRFGNEFIKTLREKNLKKQIEFLIKHNKCSKKV